MTHSDDEIRGPRPSAPAEGERQDDDGESPQQQRQTLRAEDDSSSGHSKADRDSEAR
jgi:hypothetical protein